MQHSAYSGWGVCDRMHVHMPKCEYPTLDVFKSISLLNQSIVIGITKVVFKQRSIGCGKSTPAIQPQICVLSYLGYESLLSQECFHDISPSMVQKKTVWEEIKWAMKTSPANSDTKLSSKTRGSYCSRVIFVYFFLRKKFQFEDEKELEFKLQVAQTFSISNQDSEAIAWRYCFIVISNKEKHSYYVLCNFR